MRNAFTTYDIKEILQGLMKSQDEKIILRADGEDQEVSLLDYLNIELYVWKDRIVSTPTGLSNLDDWLNSLNTSLNRAFGLVEITNVKALASQEIDSATLDAKVTFLIQADKVSNLDRLFTNIRAANIGKPQKIQNSSGEITMAYVNMGFLMYDDEPFATQVGEVIQVSVNFGISYLTEALTYESNPVYISLNGNVEDKYQSIPFTKGTAQAIFNSQAYPSQVAPNRTGVVNTSVSMVMTFSYFDFNKELMLALDEIFWSLGASYIDGNAITNQTVNIPVWLKVVTGGHTYVYKKVITNMQKDITNSDFNVSSITLKPYSKNGD